MNNSENLRPSEIQQLQQGIVLLLISIIGFSIIGPLLGISISTLFSNLGMIKSFEIAGRPQQFPEGRMVLYFAQAGATLGMAGLPYMALKLLKWPSNLSNITNNSLLLPLLLSAVITISFMGVNGIIVEWNEHMVLPEFMKGLEEWARALEEQGKRMTEFLTNISSIPSLVLALFIIAIFPAIAEEYVFRGILQNKLYHATNKVHFSIWLSAILFSAIHMQFFGFFPRMFLGALFGYMYFWSKSFYIPVFAHFVNNGFSLIIIYLSKTGSIKYDIENTPPPTLATVGIFSIITVSLIYYFRKIHTE